MSAADTTTTLCIDFGNTRQKAALFAGAAQQEVAFFDEDLLASTRRLLDAWRPDRCILSSVINHPPEVTALLEARTRLHVLHAASRLPFSTPVGKPETIGADRLALCAAAVQLFPNQNNLVIGLGTAVTYNFINVKNEFLGGGISPGMIMRMRSLNSFTARLPIVEPHWNVPLVGYDTRTNIQSGVVLGLAMEIDGFIEAYKSRYGAFNVLLTGGDLVHLAPHLKNLIFADPDLLFKGLYAICDLNV
ncbi:MAG: type III pantothenate kinase [Chitinophagaceae bacterium]|nr:type III pantothenate kinase [Chitinophagaceae bacterium]